MLRMRTILKGKLHTRPPPLPPTLYAETSDASTKSHRVGSELLLVIHTRTRAVWARPLHAQMHSSAKSTTRPWYDKYTGLLDQNLYFSFLKRS